MSLVAGFDIGGTKARLALFDGGWEAVAENRRGTRDITEPEGLADAMREMLLDALEQAGREPGDLDVVGVGIAAQLDVDHETLINAPNLGWRDIAFADQLRDVLSDQFDAPLVRLANDLSASLWGEHDRGAVTDVGDVLAVAVGTGVGGAMLTDGELVDGAGGKAGEIGHVKVAPGGRVCGCGQRGCVEAYAGGAALERRVAAIGQRESLEELGAGDDVDLGVADELYDDVDAINQLWEEATDYLAVSIANACTLLNPAVLLLGGGVVDNLPNFKRLLVTKTTPLILAAARDDLDIRYPELGDRAGTLGAALLARRAADR